MTAGLRGIYRKVCFGRPVIVVSGLPRSGTSMAMRMLEAAGLSIFTDGIRSADEDNPHGYYEYERVRGLAEERNKSWLRDARGQVIKIISHLLPELPRHNNYKVIFMRRNLREVLASQTAMLKRRGEPSDTSDDRMLELYKNHFREIRRLIDTAAHLEALEVGYGQVLKNPVEAAIQIRDFLELDLDVRAMAATVDVKLYRNRVRPRA